MIQIRYDGYSEHKNYGYPLFCGPGLFLVYTIDGE